MTRPSSPPSPPSPSSSQPSHSSPRSPNSSPPSPQDILSRAEALQRSLGGSFRDRMVEKLYQEAEQIARRAAVFPGKRYDFDQKIDRIVTSPLYGIPIMLLLLASVLWLTIVGANVPSAMLAKGLFWIEGQGVKLFDSWGAPWWLTGFLWRGVYRCTAWVISVMLPPMAIFFPAFTILEDLGYLPRVAFNLDWLFRRAGAHGKMALTMGMGYGCNAAGIIATRIIDSPRERLIAILTNNFAPCNGRFPTLIMLASLFVAVRFPPAVASFAAAGAVMGLFSSASDSRWPRRGRSREHGCAAKPPPSPSSCRPTAARASCESSTPR